MSSNVSSPGRLSVFLHIDDKRIKREQERYGETEKHKELVDFYRLILDI